MREVEADVDLKRRRRRWLDGGMAVARGAVEDAGEMTTKARTTR